MEFISKEHAVPVRETASRSLLRGTFPLASAIKALPFLGLALAAFPPTSAEAAGAKKPTVKTLSPAPRIAGWMASWDSPEELAITLASLSKIETVWLFGSSAAWLLPAAGKEKTPEANLEWEVSEAMTTAMNQAKAKKIRFGPVIHNSGPSGFEAGLALKIFENEAVALDRLASEAKKRGWTAINLDFESLPATATANYERFVAALAQRFAKTGIAISICLHAQTIDDTPDGARFQRWKNLAKLPVNFIVMAYDHAWASSPPGPVAPKAWIDSILEKVAKELPMSRFTLALPVYGYHWQKNEFGEWRGTPEVAVTLSKRVSDDPVWIKDSALPVHDGAIYRKPGHVIAFDNDASVAAKYKALKNKNVTRIALWRLGGEDGSIYRAFEKTP